MLDIRSNLILKYLASVCEAGGYRVIEIKDLIGSLPKKFNADASVISFCMQHLEQGNYIMVKYKDAKMYCLCMLPLAWQVLENEASNKQKTKRMIKMGSMLYFLVFIFAFLGAFMAILFYGIIF